MQATGAGDELLQVYERVDALCGELIDAAEAQYGEEPTVLLFSDHGMKPIYWMFHLDRWLEERGHLRFRKRSLQPWRRGRLDYLARVDQKLVRTVRLVRPRARPAPVPAAARRATALFADIDFGSTRAYGFASQGPALPRRVDRRARRPRLHRRARGGARRDPASRRRASRRSRCCARRSSGRGPFLDKAPELMLIPHDERINVDPSRRRWTQAFERHEQLDPEVSYGYSGHHGVTGILAATGPGIQPADLPDGAEIVQLPATILRLLGLSAEGLDGEPLAAILEEDAGATAETVAAGDPARGERRARLLRGGGAADGRAPPRPRLRVAPTRRLPFRLHAQRQEGETAAA